MASFLESFRGEAYALFRIVAGFLFAAHGSQKLFSFPSAAPPNLPDFVQYGAGGIELVGGVLIMIGLLTHYSAFLASGLMAFAYWMVHGGKGLLHGGKALFPIANEGELAALFCFAFLMIATHGSGMWSVDSLRSGGPNPAEPD